jgi:hypothetical protein
MPNSHLGQQISNHITLGCYGTVQGDSSVTWIFYRIFPDGTADGFSIPKGKALVVTDVDWNYNTGEHNAMQTFSILMKVPKKEIRNVVFVSTAPGDTNGSGGASVSMTTGFVVSNMNNIEPNLESSGSINDIILRGYLIDAPKVRRWRKKENFKAQHLG